MSESDPPRDPDSRIPSGPFYAASVLRSNVYTVATVATCRGCEGVRNSGGLCTWKCDHTDQRLGGHVLKQQRRDQDRIAPERRLVAAPRNESQPATIAGAAPGERCVVETSIATNANHVDAQKAVGAPRRRAGRCSPHGDPLLLHGIGFRTSRRQGRRPRLGCARQLKAPGRLLGPRNASLPLSRGQR